MMDKNEQWPSDDFWLDLADGKVDAATLRELVATCRRQPSLWERCAVALLEERVLQQELRSLSGAALGDQRADHRRADHSTSPAALSAGGAIDADVHRQPVVTGELAANLPESKSRSSIAWINNLALVAVVLVAFCVGWQSSQRWQSSQSWHGWPAVANSPALPSSTETGRNDLAVAAGQGSSEVMVVSDPKMPLPPELINEWNERVLTNALAVPQDPEGQRRVNELRKRGYEVETKRGAIPLLLQDGRPAIVPFEQVNVRPRFKNAY